MSKISEIGVIGERIVDNALRASGFTTNWDTRQPGSTDIEATGNKRRLLVQVKTSMEPRFPASLSDDELAALTSRATREKCEAWEARVRLNAKHEPMETIRWKKVN